MFSLVSCIPQNEMVVLAADMNWHVGSNNVGYDGMHGGYGLYGYAVRNADGSRILEFADGLNLVINIHKGELNSAISSTAANRIVTRLYT